jgi:hypothetical protein
MSPDSAGLPMRIAPSVPGQCRRVPLIGIALIALLLTGLTLPSAALAHGPVNPAASSYLATASRAPAGLRAIVVDGDQRMWLSADPRLTVVVLDYRGAPYLRFSARGVEVNRNSAMYYSNQVPAEQVPPGIGPGTPPSWSTVSSGHGYSWHDGRLHALAATALAPGSSYVGAWRIPLRINGRASAISGGLSYAPDPSLAWFWPIAVAVACVLAGLRLHETGLDRRLARGLALVALVGVGVAGTGEELHGRPGVSAGQYVLLAVVLAFVAWGLARLVRRREGWFGYFVIALAAIWEGASLVGVLTHGFVLIDLPAPVARIAVIACLASGSALLPVIFRLAERPDRSDSASAARGVTAWEDDESWVGDL